MKSKVNQSKDKENINSFPGGRDEEGWGKEERSVFY